jgi:hypothetical protein
MAPITIPDTSHPRACESSLAVRASEHPPESPVDALGGATQTLFVAQTFGATQLATDVQLIAHAPPVQMYGAQSFSAFESRTVCPSGSHVAPDAHLPLVHRPPVAQSVSVAHVVLHCPVAVSHWNVPQLMGLPAGQCPFPSQLAPGIDVVGP